MSMKQRYNFKQFGEDYKKQEDEKRGYVKDSSMWRPEFKDGVCNATIRFLPDPSGTPFVKYQDHSTEYKINGAVKKRWKKCINTFGKEGCPFCAKSWELHESTFKTDKDYGMKLIRKEHYISNILVIKHEARPEDEGKVFKFDFAAVSQKYFSKAMPTDDDRKAPDFSEFWPCDPIGGANFYLVSKKNGNFANGTAIPNYAESRFLNQSSICKTDEELDKLEAQTFDLSGYLNRDEYPSNEDALKDLEEILLSWGLESKEEKTDSQSFVFGDLDDGGDIPDFSFDSTTPDLPLNIDGSDDSDAFLDDLLNTTSK